MTRVAMTRATSIINWAAVLLAFVSLAGGCASPAAAQSCSAGTEPVVFGAYDTLASGSVDGTGRVLVHCDAPADYVITLTPGNGTVAAREMQGGANRLLYNLYTDPTYLTPWGDGSGTGTTVGAAGTQADITVYGRIPARQNVPAGAYADVIGVTVRF